MTLTLSLGLGRRQYTIRLGLLYLSLGYTRVDPPRMAELIVRPWRVDVVRWH